MHYSIRVLDWALKLPELRIQARRLHQNRLSWHKLHRTPGGGCKDNSIIKYIHCVHMKIPNIREFIKSNLIFVKNRKILRVIPDHEYYWQNHHCHLIVVWTRQILDTTQYENNTSELINMQMRVSIVVQMIGHRIIEFFRDFDMKNMPKQKSIDRSLVMRWLMGELLFKCLTSVRLCDPPILQTKWSVTPSLRPLEGN